MSARAVIAIGVIIMLIMFAPVVFADLVERLFSGLGAVLTEWSTEG